MEERLKANPVISLWSGKPNQGQYLGCGVCITPERAITAFHVVDGINIGELFVGLIPDRDTGLSVCKVYQHDDGRDIAIIELSRPHGKPICPCDFSATLSAGSDIELLAYHKEEGAIREGIAVNLSNWVEPNTWEFHTWPAKGMSGGGALRSGKLVGVIQARDKEENSGLMIPLRSVQEFVRSFLPSSQIHPAWKNSNLDAFASATHLARRYRSEADAFTPLFLRADTTGTLPTISVLPAILLWTYRGPIEDMPDGQIDVSNEFAGKALLLIEVVDKYPILVLRGDPGTGKTTSCRYLVYLAASKFLSNPQKGKSFPLPVFVELNRFHVNDGESGDDALARLIASALRENNALPPDSIPSASDGRVWLTQAEQDQPLALYLDGLNEIPPKYKGIAETALKRLAERLRDTDSRLIITTRRYGFETWKLNLDVYDLQPLKPDAIKDYLQKQLDWDVERIEKLYGQQLGSRLRLQASNPLLLNLLCDVLRQQPDNPPASRGELYRIFIQGVLERWENNVKDNDYGQRNFSAKDKQQALEQFGFHMQTVGRVVSVAITTKLFAEVLAITGQQAEALLEEICVNHLLLKRGDSVEFTHHTLQEYFCAAALYHQWKGARHREMLNGHPVSSKH